MLPITSPAFQEAMLLVAEGITLRLRVVEMPEEEVEAEVVLTHGFGEHSRRYEHVAAAFAGCGIRTWTYDLRGHGRSGGRRGDASTYDLFLDDLAKVVERASGTGRPCFLLGHSFGGQITLRYLQERKPEVRGAVICSPWLKLAFDPPWWRIALARMAFRVCPGWTQNTPAQMAHLSRDQEYLLSMPDLDLMHRLLSPRLYFAMEAAGRKALEEAGALHVPLLLIHGEADRVTCALATQELYERAMSTDKTLLLYPEARHETHNDLCRDRVLSDICRWICDRTAP